MVKVYAGDTLIAESNETIVVEGNQYFPPDSIINKETIFSDSSTSTVCPWKGTAAYYNATLPGQAVVRDIAWYYPIPKDAAKNITGYVAFYKNKVTITGS